MRRHAGVQTGVPRGRLGGQVALPRSAPSQTSPHAVSMIPLPHAASQGTGGGTVVTVVDDVVVEEVVAVEDVVVEVDVVVVVDVVMVVVVVVVGQPGICSQKPSGLIQ